MTSNTRAIGGGAPGCRRLRIEHRAPYGRRLAGRRVGEKAPALPGRPVLANCFLESGVKAVELDIELRLMLADPTGVHKTQTAP
ncbi:hypothetical protein [Pollutimonas subterranea]|uniref:hypothetical protein n=1 Tax=Pollutimonas subterranea TaxID=2045210 RepID=UPI00117E9BD5|nr:hypothetical protein [Pollutimonas subterranea]